MGAVIPEAAPERSRYENLCRTTVYRNHINAFVKPEIGVVRVILFCKHCAIERMNHHACGGRGCYRHHTGGDMYMRPLFMQGVDRAALDRFHRHAGK